MEVVQKSPMPSSLQSSLEASVNDVDLPVIDISEFDGEELSHLQHHHAVAAVREACENWVCFCVVGHGIPVDLQQNVQSVIKELFAMPTEAKERFATSVPNDGYVHTPWRERFNILKLPDSHSVQELTDKIWPNSGNTNFSETIRTYIFCLADLALKICKIVLAGLGLDMDTFYHSDFEKCTAYMRIQHYSSNGKSVEDEAFGSHTDVGCFTILSQDDAGGLQIRSREGKWLNVKPLSNSFVVNIGDSLKAWSNGRYLNVEHRVVYQGWRDRISVGYFTIFPDDKQIWAPEELVDDDHPRRYRAYNSSHFKEEYINNIYSKKPNFIDRYSNLIDRYAGI